MDEHQWLFTYDLCVSNSYSLSFTLLSVLFFLMVSLSKFLKILSKFPKKSLKSECLWTIYSSCALLLSPGELFPHHINISNRLVFHGELSCWILAWREWNLLILESLWLMLPGACWSFVGRDGSLKARLTKRMIFFLCFSISELCTWPAGRAFAWVSLDSRLAKLKIILFLDLCSNLGLSV